MARSRATTRWVVTLAAAVLLTACTTSESGSGSAGSAGASSSKTAASRPLAIYYVADTAVGPRLYREFHSVPTVVDGPSDAVRELLARATGDDPDYRSFWPSGTELRNPVAHEAGVITLDLSANVLTAQLGSAVADLTVQQLVYTVQAALQNTDPVRILVDGKPVPQLWGQVPTSEPVRRADPYQTRSLVQIDEPTHGGPVGRTVQVKGEAAAFEANVPWEVLRDGKVVQHGAATTAEGQRFSAFSFTVTLEPGDYVLRVVEDDPSAGAGRPPFADTKSIKVT
jgi:hypothetical protein